MTLAISTTGGVESLAAAPIKTALNQQKTNGKLAVALIEAAAPQALRTPALPPLDGAKGGFINTRA